MSQFPDISASRRGLLAMASSLVAVTAFRPLPVQAGPWNAARRLPGRGPVVSLHMDRPYLDSTGQALAFRPPAGTRSADLLGDLDDEQHRWLNPFG